LERALGVYSDLLGLRESRRVEDAGRLRAVWLRAGETILMLELALRGRGAEAGSAHVLAFAVDDLRAWEQRLAARGIAIVDRTQHTLYVQDPDGYRVGLTSFPRA
jgi:catechol 2,3-dioxygenase-like lactoylglutathione lyase family enzyme